jgi:hypothetical protein
MHKLTILTAGMAMLATGCQFTAPSPTWELVRKAPHTGPGASERGRTYAEELHKLLQKAGVEHKVVTFTFRYPTSLMIDAPAEDVAVIYKDAASPGHPWWLATDCLWRPIWLPTQSVARQIDFYLARPTQIVSVAEYPAGAPAKSKVRKSRAGSRMTADDAGSKKAGGAAEKAPEPVLQPPPGVEPSGQPAPKEQPQVAPPMPAPKPAGAPEDGKPAPKVEPPPIRSGPPKTIPVRIELSEPVEQTLLVADTRDFI